MGPYVTWYIMRNNGTHYPTTANYSVFCAPLFWAFVLCFQRRKYVKVLGNSKPIFFLGANIGVNFYIVACVRKKQHKRKIHSCNGQKCSQNCKEILPENMILSSLRSSMQKKKKKKKYQLKNNKV
eukprot:TRINITY_DN5413_c1_g1_i1.p3 TRINITY_DN5413_c1_g1~~TRINITY_DN5413_c1_g1_i1.p3  ORF type:complete len:125 (-),score=1.82 TRINITY_DN5413_c1_g1_i1:64-438(-)